MQVLNEFPLQIEGYQLIKRIERGKLREFCLY